MLVNLVETPSWSRPGSAGPGTDREYVTLSHCWGLTVGERHKMTSENYDMFRDGVAVQTLPKTFQDAILFAARLDGVGYIWIDSICIMQGDKDDWLTQSAVMHQIYSETYLNLSATSSPNSEGGLFREMEYSILDEETVLINIEGLPQAYKGTYPPKRNDCSDLEAVNAPISQRDRMFVQPCTIVDESLWTKRVDQGAVNTRGWVLQERLMSPRVMHFCHDQVSWECCGLADRRKLQPSKLHDSGPPNRKQFSGRDIVEGIQRKSATSNTSSRTNADRSTASSLTLWSEVVNAYTKTALTQPGDKLVALSGLATLFSCDIGAQYITGLWQTSHLASQLLWHVEPAFNHTTRSFSHPGASPDDGRAPPRAPSFSWAAIDVTGHGIAFPTVTDRGVLVRVEDCPVVPLTGNVFGVIRKARITLWGRLREARLMSRPGNRFAWCLVGCGEMDAEWHTNVYLDCPERDRGCIDNAAARVFVLPVIKESYVKGTARNQYLTCLLLRLDGTRGVFRRVGMTKLSPHADRMAMREVGGRDGVEYAVLRPCKADGMVPSDRIEEGSGLHRIHLE